MGMAEKIIRELSTEISRDRILRKITGAAQITDSFFNREYYVAQRQIGQRSCQQEYK